MIRLPKFCCDAYMVELNCRWFYGGLHYHIYTTGWGSCIFVFPTGRWGLFHMKILHYHFTRILVFKYMRVTFPIIQHSPSLCYCWIYLKGYKGLVITPTIVLLPGLILFAIFSRCSPSLPNWCTALIATCSLYIGGNQSAVMSTSIRNLSMMMNNGYKLRHHASEKLIKSDSNLLI